MGSCLGFSTSLDSLIEDKIAGCISSILSYIIDSWLVDLKISLNKQTSFESQKNDILAVFLN